MKQVDKTHYDYSKYQSPARFTSYYYQIKSVLDLSAKSLLEIGIGDGTFISMAKNHGIEAYGMDFDKELSPSLCASATHIPLHDQSIDVVAAFQVLEHIPYEKLLCVAKEMHRICRNGVIVSLPEVGNASVTISAPFSRKIGIVIPHFIPFRRRHKFNGEHYWEINKRGFPLSRIINTFREAGLNCKKTWINPYYSYHRFFIFEKL